MRTIPQHAVYGQRKRSACGTVVSWLALWLLFAVPQARGQYIAIGGGGVFPRDLSAAPASEGPGGPARSEFTNSALFAVDVGTGVLPFFSLGAHYSYTRPELTLRRSDPFGSSAVVDLATHTLTLDGRLRTPEAAGFRLYGLAGVGFSRFRLDVKELVEVPFPDGIPDNVLSPVVTFGAGLERNIAPLVRLKLEVRDYLTPISKRFFEGGGAWHRVAVIGGIVLGR